MSNHAITRLEEEMFSLLAQHTMILVSTAYNDALQHNMLRETEREIIDVERALIFLRARVGAISNISKDNQARIDLVCQAGTL